ncbi:hypothetical protein BUALT_Bualt09G0134200 [Buddleja alternifolia]|uniref:Uncharacterized protein n=1 Tax=Buddleja alternifolia TaxID=168488 RepID=A0AAV6XD93_9LAMI|nr:hypothetical protein BUALT_Bualt09G0134200 [Buddleja alternifolia]
MMARSTPDFHEKSFRIKHEDDKFFSRLLSKETSKSNPSFRVYYGDVSSAVPFMWETRPGTPKHTSSDNFVPPLTPPPSYYTNNLNNSSKKQSKSKLIFHTLLRRMNPRKVHVASSPSSSSSLSSLSWSSSHSSFSDPMMSTPTTYLHKRRRFSSWGSSFDERSTIAIDDHRVRNEASRASNRDHGMCGSSSRMCFGIGKKTLLSLVRRGSA